MDRLVTNRNYKDTIFRLLFSGKKELLELYNAVNGTSYADEEALEVRTLENAIYMGVKNDVSFILYDQLHLYEHQSTINPNIPLRDLIYTADLLKGMSVYKDVYSSRKVLIPEPRFVVFYNGKAEMEDDTIYRLSDLYKKPTGDPDLDLRVRVLNINLDRNRKIVNASRTLRDYTVFVEKARRLAEQLSADEAVDRAVQECIKEGILQDFLTRHRSEVVAMWLYEYDEELHKEVLREEAREDGLAEGRAKGLEEGRAEGRAEERVNTERERARADASEKELRLLREELSRLRAELDALGKA